MARPLRIQFEGAWYHVMNRGANRKKTFYTNKDKNYFLKLLGKTSTIYKVEIHAYCLMDNHYHLLLHTPMANLSDAMRYLGSLYTQYFNKSKRKDGALFRGRYKSILVGGEGYLLRLSRYIHLNPKQAKITSKLEGYRWSSYPAYLNIASTPEWLKKYEIEKRFTKRGFKGGYKAFVEIENDEALTKFYDNEKFCPVLGSKAFNEAVTIFLKSQSLSPEIVGQKNITKPPNISMIIKQVSCAFCVSEENIRQSCRGKRNNARKAAMLLCREAGLHSLAEIGKQMGDISYKTVSTIITQAKSDSRLIADVEKIKRLLAGRNQHDVRESEI